MVGAYCRAACRPAARKVATTGGIEAEHGHQRRPGELIRNAQGINPVVVASNDGNAVGFGTGSRSGTHVRLGQRKVTVMSGGLTQTTALE
jgi:hypothetical protein